MSRERILSISAIIATILAVGMILYTIVYIFGMLT